MTQLLSSLKYTSSNNSLLNTIIIILQIVSLCMKMSIKNTKRQITIRDRPFITYDIKVSG